LVKKTDYFSLQMKSMIKDYFNNSAAQFASFFTTESNLSEKDLKEIQKLIGEQIKTKNKEK